MTNTTNRAGIDFYRGSTPRSTFHRWTVEDDMLVCLSCGGTWEQDEDGEPQASNGDAPTECLAELSPIHGDRRENGHDMDCPGGFSGHCKRCCHLCNCVQCS